jgi:hypothetical protein
MHIALAFVEFVLGYVPLILTVVALATALWGATKLFPEFGAKFDAFMDRLFGTDENYDERYAPTSTTSIDQYV